MPQNKFSALPLATILEICSYLDVESLMAVADKSQLNREMRNLSLSYKLYWLPAVLREDLNLPLPLLRPWTSFSPSELNIATRKAVYRERNLSLDRPKLRSSARITWPFSGTKTPSGGSGPPTGESLKNQEPSDVSWIPSSHSNGEWYFALSKDFILRVLHLRTATLVLEERLYDPGFTPVPAPSAYSIETVDEFAVRVAVATPHPDSAQAVYSSILSAYTLELDPQRRTACIKLLSQIPLRILPKLFDIAGDYAVLVGDGEGWPTSGPVHVVEWKTGREIHLPLLFNSFAVAGFPDYFISLGVDSEDNIELQVVSLPLPNQTAYDAERHTNGDGDDGSQDSGFILACSIPIRSDLKDTKIYPHDYTVICHRYKGRTINNIRLWFRDDFFGTCYSVFSISVDFSKPPKQWFSPLQPPFEGETPQYAIEHRRLSEKEGVVRSIVVGTSGRRFFWWKEDLPPANSDPPVDDSLKIIRLYSSDIDILSPLALPVPDDDESPEVPKSDGTWMEEINDMMLRYEKCVAYPSREMECPFYCPIPRQSSWDDHSDHSDEEGDGECVYSVVSEDWSGTVLVTLTCGDLLVLRYGHP